MELSIIIPCLNEAGTIAPCVTAALNALKDHAISGEVLIVDNGSTDGSAAIARSAGARVIPENRRGYGAALRAGIEQARGKYIIMADADGSYDLGNITPFLEKLRTGYNLVMGNRFTGGIEKGAMPFLNRHLGNPLLSFIAGMLYTRSVGDYACGQRAFSRKAALDMRLKTTGMEFAYELIIRAHQRGLMISEVPVRLYRDKRKGKPKLRPWRDGLRTLWLIVTMIPA